MELQREHTLKRVSIIRTFIIGLRCIRLLLLQ